MAEAVHQAVREVTGSDGFGYCPLYAWAGAVVASVVTGSDYDLHAGAVTVWTGDVNADGELALLVDPDGAEFDHPALGTIRGGRANGELHAWFSPRPPAAVPGEVMEISRAELVIADLGMRHLRRHVTEAAMPWKRAPLPAYCWASAASVSMRLRVDYYPDPDTTALVLGKLGQMGAAPRDAAVLALRLLGRCGPTTTKGRREVMTVTRADQRPESPAELAYLKVTRPDHADQATYTAVRPADAARITARSSASLVIEQCGPPGLPADVCIGLAAELAADPARAEVIVGTAERGYWINGPLHTLAAP